MSNPDPSRATRFGKGNKASKGRGGRPKGSIARPFTEAREFAWRVISDPSYQENLVERIKKGQALHMEQLLWHYKFGKPVETVKVEDKTRPPVLIIGMQTPRHDPLALPEPEPEPEAKPAEGEEETILDVSGILDFVRRREPPERMDRHAEDSTVPGS